MLFLRFVIETLLAAGAVTLFVIFVGIFVAIFGGS